MISVHMLHAPHIGFSFWYISLPSTGNQRPELSRKWSSPGYAKELEPAKPRVANFDFFSVIIIMS